MQKERYSFVERNYHLLSNELQAVVSGSDPVTDRPNGYPLDLLCSRFGLSSIERKILLLSLSSMLGTAGDTTRFEPFDRERFQKSITQAFSEDERPALMMTLSGASSLVRCGLIGIHNVLAEDASVFTIHGFRRVLRFLLGKGDVDLLLHESVRSFEPDRLIFFPDEKKKVTRLNFLCNDQDTAEDVRLCLLSGRSVMRRQRWIESMRMPGMRIVQLSLNHYWRSPPRNLELFKKNLIRECMMLQAPLLITIEERDASAKQIEPIHMENTVLDLIDGNPMPVIVSSSRPFVLSDEGRFRAGRRVLQIAFDAPDIKERTELWSRVLSVNPELQAEASGLAQRFKMTEDQILVSAEHAEALSVVRSLSEEESPMTIEDIEAACRARNRLNSAKSVKKIETAANWEDLVLPDDHVDRLRELALHLKHADIVHNQWGFAKKGTMGRGIHVLFSGRSGTGKTMAAGVIAKEAGLDLYRIDLAGIVSKYIGETEKNLSLIFDEASNSNAILFFDEADALFGKRSEVKDAKDRYANIEVAYLLQKMEEYEGMTILATNLASNLDDAFRRRLHFMIEFPMPDPALSRKLWKKIFPDNAPVCDDLDYDFLSKELQLSGGSIRNIALNAAVYAASASSNIAMRHVMRAVRREYQKTGRPFGPEDMKQYYEMAMGEVN
jgi:SpoVK/Ycf46/Vps4 family AAA+-type ATPase